MNSIKNIDPTAYYIVLIMIAIASGGILYDTVTQTGDNLDSAEQLGKDLQDGSLDNYTQKEAEKILDNLKNSRNAPLTIIASIMFLGISLLGLFGAYESRRGGEE